MTITWDSPAAGLLTSEIELTAGTPVYETTFDADNITNNPDSNTAPVYGSIYYKHVAGDLPEYSEIIQLGSTADFKITPLVRELDDYIEAYAEPPNFSYDNEDSAGGNYATFGSALHGGYTATFTIRAYDATGLLTDTDSNGNLIYIEDDLSARTFADRIFSVSITNNWSSDRDRFILRYYENTPLEYSGTKYDNPEDFLVRIKQDGYYT